MRTNNVDLLIKAARQVCDEDGIPWPEGAEAEFQDPHAERVADVFAGLVLANDAELKRIEAYMREHIEQRPCVVRLPAPVQEPTCKQPLQVHKPTGWMAHKNQYAVPVLFNPYTGEPRDVRDVQSDPQGILIVPPGKVEMLAAQQPALTTCNCRWDGETQVQQCTLHESHFDVIHEWAERAKTAEKLAQQPAPVQEPVTKISLKDGKCLKLEPHYFFGPTCWILYTNSGEQIRALDEFEAGFVNAALKAAPQAQQPAPPADVPMQWPKARDVGRYGDMSQTAHLRVGLDTDSDVYVSVRDDEGGATIEFCTPGSGGGKSPRTREALIALMVAIEADNAKTPSLDWWAARQKAGPPSTGA